MTTKELLLRQIEQLDEEELDALFAWVQQFLEQKKEDDQTGFLERLSEIRISGPEDLSENFDLYLRGEKSFDTATR